MERHIRYPFVKSFHNSLKYVRFPFKFFFVSVLLFFIFQTSYFVFSSLVPMYIIPSSDYLLFMQASFHFVIAITILVSSFFVDRINNWVLIYTSSIATILMTVLLLFAPNDVFKIAILFVVGIFFSIGLLGFFAYFWRSTVPEERGRISGLIGFVALPINFIVSHFVAPSLDFLGTMMLSIIVSLGILVIVLLKPKKAVLAAKNGEGNYPEKRTVLLYSIPWIL